MYSGFITTKRTLRKIGIHQRFDVAAYNMIKPYLRPGTFPELKDVLHFEGFNGPDGLKVKSPGEHEPSHLYDPVADVGEVPQHITSHYQGLVASLRAHDLVRAAFEAAWLAHYVTDGLTPAHHYPLDVKLAELSVTDTHPLPQTLLRKALSTADEPPLMVFRRNWLIWGPKGLLSTHQNFEMGVASALLFFPLRARLRDDDLAAASSLGYLQYFKREARRIAELKVYERFYENGWSADLAKTVRDVIAPHTLQAVGTIWLLAYIEAGQEVTAGQVKLGSPVKRSVRTKRN